MTTKLIKHNEYWIVVSDSYNSSGGWHYNKEYNFIHNKTRNSVTDFSLEILFSQNPEHNLPTITFSDEVAKKLGVVDVEKLAYDWLYEEETQEKVRICKYPLVPMEYGFFNGYNQCLSDNADKKFTLEDMRGAYNQGMENQTIALNGETYDLNFERFIQSLTKEEFFCELEMEYKNGWSKNLVEYANEPKELHLQPKITNNSCKVIKIWK